MLIISILCALALRLFAPSIFLAKQSGKEAIYFSIWHPSCYSLLHCFLACYPLVARSVAHPRGGPSHPLANFPFPFSPPPRSQNFEKTLQTKIMLFYGSLFFFF